MSESKRVPLGHRASCEWLLSRGVSDCTCGAVAPEEIGFVTAKALWLDRESLRAERDALRAALREIVETCQCEAESLVIGGSTAQQWIARQIHAVEAARALLAEDAPK